MQDHPASDSTAVIAALIGPGGAPVEATLFGASPRSPAAFLARFSAGRSDLVETMRDQVRATGIARVGSDDVISVEVVYAPGGKIGNVLVRPALCDETIALHGASGGTMTLDRLLLRIEGDRLAVYDAPTGRPVMLFLSSAHGTEAEHLDPLYRLLANLCHRATRPWSWGGLAKLSHLPRVRCGNVVVSAERWLLTGAEVKAAVDAPDSAAALRSLLPGLGDRRWLGIGATDQKLAIDVTSAAAVTEILGRHTKSSSIELTELPHVEHPAVRGPYGDHVAEIALARAGGRPRHRDTAPQAALLVRSEWVYAQYFCGPSSSERVITAVADLAHRLRAEHVADLWFFIRYGDGGNHIRARIRATDEVARRRVLAEMEDLGSTMLAEDTITSFRMEPYVPEVRRYGGPQGIGAAERLFSTDSDDVAARVGSNPEEVDRLIMAGCDVYTWWAAAARRRHPDLGTLKRAQRNMTRGGAPDRRTVGKVVRQHRREFDSRFEPTAPPGIEAELTNLVTVLTDAWDEHQVADVVGSVVHMHCNRMFAFDPRRMEYLAYEFAIQKALQVRALEATAGVEQ